MGLLWHQKGEQDAQLASHRLCVQPPRATSLMDLATIGCGLINLSPDLDVLATGSRSFVPVGNWPGFRVACRVDAAGPVDDTLADALQPKPGGTLLVVAA